MAEKMVLVKYYFRSYGNGRNDGSSYRCQLDIINSLIKHPSVIVTGVENFALVVYLHCCK